MGRYRIYKRKKKKVKPSGYVNIGEVIRKELMFKWIYPEDARNLGICCVSNCNKDYVEIYMGFPLCRKHSKQLERHIEKRFF